MENPPDMFHLPPEASPDDVWGDSACHSPESQGHPVSLPPKRVREGKPGTPNDGGLRIGSRSSNEPAAAITRIEVQEIHGHVVRLDPEEPEAPKMPRHVVFHEKPVGADEAPMIEETHGWGRSKKQPILWLLGTSAVIAVVVAAATLLLPFVNKSNASRPGSGESELVVESVANGEAMADMLSRRAEAGHVMHDVLIATSPVEIPPLVRNPDAVADLIRADRRMPVLPPDAAPLKINDWIARENQSLTYGVLTGTLPDYSGFESYFTVSEGRLVLDWKASTAYGTADFSELMRKQGNPAEIRGWIEAGDFYNLAFTENSYQAYQLASPDKQQLIWAYARWGSPVHQALKALIKGGYILEGHKEAQKVTVRLDPGPGDSLPGQWEIVELLHKEWIAP